MNANQCFPLTLAHLIGLRNEIEHKVGNLKVLLLSLIIQVLSESVRLRYILLEEVRVHGVHNLVHKSWLESNLQGRGNHGPVASGCHQ